MGRWKQGEYQTTSFTITPTKVVHSHHSNFIGDVVRAHNADCDAYEARIKELENEVERRQQTLEGYFIDLIDAKARIAELEEERDAAVEFAHAAEREFCAANAAYASLLESHEFMLDSLTESDATLDRLREVVQSEEWIYAKHTDTDGQMERIEDILYPQPETNPKETTDGN